MITFIHAADLHLDTPFSGLEKTSKELAQILQQAPFQSFQKIVDKAIFEEVDFVLLVGDLYNTERVNIKAQSLFIEQLERLNAVDIPVFLTRGNHDYLTKDTQTLSLPLPENVYTYPKEVTTHQITTKNSQRVAITGFSYHSKWIFDRKIADYPSKQDATDLQIGMLHGSLDSLETTEARYAPFTVKELQAKNYDYWALGHIHKRMQISKQPLALYPGNIQGLHRNETGPKGAQLVTWSPREIKAEFFKTAPIIWQTVEVDITGTEKLAELLQKIQKPMHQLETSEDMLVSVNLVANDKMDEGLVSIIQSSEFSKQLTRQVALPKQWITHVELHIKETHRHVGLEKLYPKIWTDVVEKSQAKADFNEKTANIFQQIPSKYLLETNKEAYREAMLKKAIEKIQLK